QLVFASCQTRNSTRFARPCEPLFPDRRLMGQEDFASLAGRLHDGEAHLEGAETPAPIVGDRLAEVDRPVELRQLGVAASVTLGDQLFTPSLVAIDVQPIRGLAHIAALAACDRHAEPALARRERTAYLALPSAGLRPVAVPLVGAAKAHRLLVRLDVRG